MKKIYILFLFCLLNSQENIDYKINIFGFPAAKCTYSLADTIFNDIPSIIINYEVKTVGLYDFFYPVKNKYSIIFNKYSYQVLSYYKKSIQPGVKNEIKTKFVDSMPLYDNGDYIGKDETNIFVLLYLLSNGLINEVNNFPVIDREGKKFNYQFSIINKFSYLINLNQIDKMDAGVIQDTDIFTWGLFLPKTESMIYLDEKLPLINKSIFKKGIIRMVANRIK